MVLTPGTCNLHSGLRAIAASITWSREQVAISTGSSTGVQDVTGKTEKTRMSKSITTRIFVFIRRCLLIYLSLYYPVFYSIEAPNKILYRVGVVLLIYNLVP